MPLSLRPLHPVFAAEASGLDLRRPLAEAEIDAVVEAMDRYGVLLFRGQPMDEAQQVAFATQFGPLNPGLKQIGRQREGGAERLREAALINISNLGADGRLLARDARKVISGLANQL